MPWCEDCSRFYTPSSLPPSGECPSCGRTLAEAERVTERRATAHDRSVPWHFWLLLAAITLYLGWRLVQGAGWLWSLF